MLALLTQKDVAALFQRTTRSLRGWEKADHLVAVRIGRSVFYRASDVARLLGLNGDE